MFKLIKFELYKMSRRPRTYIGILAFIVINFLVALGIAKTGLGDIANYGANATAGLQIVGSPKNAVFVLWSVVGSFFSGPFLIMLLPFFTAMVFGEIYAGESLDGSFRTLLSRPVSRQAVISAKIIASIIYTIVLLLVLGLSAYIIGWVWFGRGDLIATGTLFHPMLAIYPESEALVRVLMCLGMNLLYLLCVGMIAFFISVWLSNPIGAIGGSVMLSITTVIISGIPYFKNIKDYFFGSHALDGQIMFFNPLPIKEIHTSIVVLGIYIIVFGLLSYLSILRKDIVA